MEQLLNGKSCAPACPMQLPGSVAENSGRLVALMNKRGEGKRQTNGGCRQAAPEPLENDRQHGDGRSGDGPSFPHLQPPIQG